LLLVAFQRYVIRRTSSIAIRADSLHYVGDLLVNAAVILALLLIANFGWTFIDPLFGLAIAAYILFNAWIIARGALDMLMDRELPEEDRRRIRELVLDDREIMGLHDLRTRASGPQTFIQCHIEMDGDLRLHEAHAIADRAEDRLREAFPGAEVIVHQDTHPPHGAREPA